MLCTLTLQAGNNVAVGTNALDSNTTGSETVAIGQAALATMTTAVRNTAVGHET